MENIQKQARKRVNQKKWFYRHFTFYMGVITFLFLLNLDYFLRGSNAYVPGMPLEEIIRFNYWWFQYPMLAWGLLLFFHYSAIFGVPFVGKLDEKWESKTFESELKHIQQKQRNASNLTSVEKLRLKELEKEVELLRKNNDSEFV